MVRHNSEHGPSNHHHTFDSEVLVHVEEYNSQLQAQYVENSKQLSQLQRMSSMHSS